LQVILPVVKLPQVDRVVLDVALLDHFQHVEPHGGVALFVFMDLLGAEAGHYSVAFHSI